ncbi:MAG TPA: acyl-CoA dehydrogenase family protein, partial [Ignavibacteria bacterium]
MEFNLTESQLEVQKLARDFAQNKVAPKAMYYDESQDFPWEFTNELGEMGFLGIMFPEEYGGSNLTTMEYAIRVEEISKADPSLGL